MAGGEWVCERVSETQCKPLYPKVMTKAVPHNPLFDLTCDPAFSQQLDTNLPSHRLNSDIMQSSNCAFR